MQPSNAHIRSLELFFQKEDGLATAKTLFSMARKGISDPMSSFSGHPLGDDWMDFVGGSISDYIEKYRGIVYVATNPVNVGLYKVGVTAKSLTDRLRSLKTAGVVGEFVEVESFCVFDRFAVEKRAHRALQSMCVRHKEFFLSDWRTVCEVVGRCVKDDEDVLRRAFGEFLKI